MTAIIVIEPRSSGTALVASAVRLGMATHAYSANRDEPPLSRELLAASVPYAVVDTDSPNAVAAAASAIGVDAIVPGVPGCEYATGVAAESAALLGLPHLQPEAAAPTHDKYRSPMHLAAAGLAVPLFALVVHRRDAMTAALRVGFLAARKPVRGGMHGTYVNSLSQLQLAVECAMHHGVVDVGHKTGNVLLLEQYPEGPECCIEGYVSSKHGPRVVAVTENLLSAEQHLAKMGQFAEASLTPDQRAALVTYVEHAAVQIGLTLAVFHAKVRITRDGPVLIKIAACLGGDRTCRLIELSRSISLPEITIRSHLGDPEPAHDADAKAAVCVSGVRSFAPVVRHRRRRTRSRQTRSPGSGGPFSYRPHSATTSGDERPCRHVLCIAPVRPTRDSRLAEALRTPGSRRACNRI
ncbi:acetyl-CoA carboxylase biotin carboxylase subunit family protein [Paraburkholderia sp. EG286B]|uniref:acetyl-CoA carboxylase biotin carboxylase subunit family protein n=1 Tax=Paraburkholderia sp. EG286B TaxID=3237011 RepID=UPI0034D17FCD